MQDSNEYKQDKSQFLKWAISIMGSIALFLLNNISDQLSKINESVQELTGRVNVVENQINHLEGKDHDHDDHLRRIDQLFFIKPKKTELE